MLVNGRKCVSESTFTSVKKVIVQLSMLMSLIVRYSFLSLSSSCSCIMFVQFLGTVAELVLPAYDLIAIGGLQVEGLTGGLLVPLKAAVSPPD